MEAVKDCGDVDGFSTRDGDEFSTMIMSPHLTDQEIAAYMVYKCVNFAGLKNSAGKTLSHVAAANGRLQLLRFLLHLRDCLHEVEFESNYSLLHISLLQGHVHCAVRLIQLGVKPSCLDKEFLTSADIVMKDRTRFDQKSEEQDLYVWGSNTTYNLGCGHNKERVLPEIHDFFQKGKIFIKQVGLEKFHSVFLDVNGEVWGCGLGVRAGLGVETTALEPRRLPLSNIIAISVSELHTLFLTQTGKVYSCGLNSCTALGYLQTQPSVAPPRKIGGIPAIKGICVAQFHSVFYSNTQLFTCGTNNGQLGHQSCDASVITTPKEVTAIKMKSATIEYVAASSGATVVLNSEGVVYLLSGFRCTRLTPKDWLLKSRMVAVVGGPSSGIDSEVKVALWTEKNILYLWRASTSEFLPCAYSAQRQLQIFDFVFTSTGCLFSTCDGEAFHGFFKDGKKSKKVEVIDVKRLPHIHRASVVAADSRGRNFAVLQVSPKKLLDEVKLTKLAKASSGGVLKDLGTLLAETHEDDTIHDVIFKVRGAIFPAHSYVIFYGNPDTVMTKLLLERNESESIETFNLEELPLEAFKTVLRYVYTMECPEASIKMFTEAEEETISAYEVYSNNKKGNKKELGDLKFVARRLGVVGFLQTLDNKPPLFKGLSRKVGLFDTVLVSEDGTRIKAHRCVLVARLEYFRVMLTHGWRESKQTELKVPMTGRLLEVLVEFIYSDRSSELEESTDVDFLSLVIVCADELLFEDLKISAGNGLQRLMNLRNAPDLLQLASTCNALQLKSFAQLYILSNLAAFLESRSLEILPDNRLEELSQLYRASLPACRRLKCSLDSLEVAVVRSLAETYPFVFDEEMELAKPSPKQPKKKRDRKTSERQRRISNNDSTEEISPVKSTTTVIRPSSPKQVSSPVIEVELSPTSKLVQRRLNIISENVREPPPREDLTSLVKATANVSLNDFPELHSARLERTASKPSKSIEIPKKFVKLSQRERRRLSSLEGETALSKNEVVSPPKSPWAIVHPPSPPATSVNHNTNKPTPVPNQMETIIGEERADRERAARMRSKPLALTQMEDRALRELEVFYNAAEAAEERITVERLIVPISAAPPVWPVTRWR